MKKQQPFGNTDNNNRPLGNTQQIYVIYVLGKEMTNCRISTYIQNQYKNAVTNIENSNGGFNNRLVITQERISQKE